MNCTALYGYVLSFSTIVFTTHYLDIKKELPKESKLITHYFNKETNIETNTNSESSAVNQLETKEELHNALHIQGQE